MTNDLRDYGESNVETLPNVDDVFAAASEPPAKPSVSASGPRPQPDKGPGGSDTTRGRSAVKVDGGSDSARQRDGG